MAKKFYAVRNGRVPGVYMTWADCEKQVKGFGGAIYSLSLRKQKLLLLWRTQAYP